MCYGFRALEGSSARRNGSWRGMDNRAYDRLRAEVRDASLLGPTPVRGAIELTLVLAVYVAVGLLIAAEVHFLYPVGLAAVGMIQATYMTHELGHCHYFRGRTSRCLSYLFGNVLTGMSRSWWARRHNRIHHGYTNVIGRDGDINSAGGAFLGRQDYPRWFHRHQHLLFWFLLPFSFLAFFGASVRFAAERRQWFELALIGLHLALPGALVSTYGFGPAALLYGGYSVWFSAALIVNHLAMPVVPLAERRSACRLAITAKTTRNVRGGALTGWLLGGGTAHVEHHLFPSTSKFHLPAIKRITRRHMAALGIEYCERGAGQIYADVFGFLRRHRAGAHDQHQAIS